MVTTINKSLIVLLSVLLITTALAGCASNSPAATPSGVTATETIQQSASAGQSATTSPATASPAPAELTPVNLSVAFWGNGGWDTDPAKTEFGKYIKQKFNITSSPWSSRGATTRKSCKCGPHPTNCRISS